MKNKREFKEESKKRQEPNNRSLRCPFQVKTKMNKNLTTFKTSIISRHPHTQPILRIRRKKYI